VGGRIREGEIKTVLLMSGLDIDGKSSFARQLHDLGIALKHKGFHAVFCSPVMLSGIDSDNGIQPSVDKYRTSQINRNTIQYHVYRYRTSPDPGSDTRHTDSFSELIRKTDANTAILLGYPDQFPFLQEDMPQGFSCFLWAQFSKPPDIDTIRRVGLVALTQKTRNFIKRAGFGGYCPVIPHGVDISVYFPIPETDRRRLKREMGLTGRFVIGSVAAHTPRKRLDTIIEAFGIFSERVENAFLIVKTDRVRSLDGSDLDRIVAEKGIADSIRIITADFDKEGIRNLYRVMDLYLTLSEWEGFCIPVIEAMACGVPVVTHPVQGPGEIVPYKEYLVPGGSVFREGETVLLRADPDQAARIMEKIFRDPEFHERLKQRGLYEVRMKYDMRIVAGFWKERIETGVL